MRVTQDIALTFFVRQWGVHAVLFIVGGQGPYYNALHAPSYLPHQ
jgi:hypothetical protein